MVSYHSHSQQIFSAIMLLWSGVGGQLSQPFSADLLSHHVAVVRGWWSAFGGQLLSYHLLWSGVGGQLLSYHVGGQYCTSSLEGPFRGAFGKKRNGSLLSPAFSFSSCCWPLAFPFSV